MRLYLLSPHVHICRTDDHVVMLDLRRGKYLGIGERLAQILESFVCDWPRGAAPHPTGQASAEQTDAILQRMVHQGLLTDGDRGRSAASLQFPLAASTLAGEDTGADVRIDVRRVVRFLVAIAKAAARLRWQRLDAIVGAVERRKARHVDRRDFPLAAAQDAVLAFERLRPLAFTTRDECLFHSLALVEFLAYEQLFPTWVIGVKTVPFGAHSWVQVGDVVFSDLPEHVRQFTPILAV